MSKFVLRIADGDMEVVKQYATKRHMSINTVVLIALDSLLLADRSQTKVNVQPGEDIIVQRRNKDGRFIKK